MVIWLTGMSGAGKTTIAKTIIKNLKSKFPEIVLVDGDTVRELFKHDLDYSIEGRLNQIKRLQDLAKFLSSQDQIVIVTALYSDPKLLSINRQIFSNYLEIYIKVPFNILVDRDTKGLYKNSINGKIKNVVGVDLPWNEPIFPDIVITPFTHKTPEEAASIIISKILDFKKKN